MSVGSVVFESVKPSEVVINTKIWKFFAILIQNDSLAKVLETRLKTKLTFKTYISLVDRRMTSPAPRPSHWWISDLIPKKSEKFEFRKNFFIIFLSVKNWPRKTKFWYFSPTHFPKNCQNKLKTILWAIYKKKSKFWKTYFFIGISVKFCNMATNVWKFWSHESKVMKHFLFFGHERF